MKGDRPHGRHDGPREGGSEDGADGPESALDQGQRAAAGVAGNHLRKQTERDRSAAEPYADEEAQGLPHHTHSAQITTVGWCLLWSVRRTMRPHMFGENALARPQTPVMPVTASVPIRRPYLAQGEKGQ